MAVSEELEKTIRAQLHALGIDAATIERRPSLTIVPKPKGLDTAGEEVLGLLEDLQAATTISKKLELLLRLAGAPSRLRRRQSMST